MTLTQKPERCYTQEPENDRRDAYSDRMPARGRDIPWRVADMFCACYETRRNHCESCLYITCITLLNFSHQMVKKHAEINTALKSVNLINLSILLQTLFSFNSFK